MKKKKKVIFRYVYFQVINKIKDIFIYVEWLFKKCFKNL